MVGLEGPAVDEEVDHAVGGDLGGGEGVDVGLDDDPGGAGRVLDFGGLEERAVKWSLFMEVEAEVDFSWALDAVDADFAVALGGVGVAAGEEGEGLLDGEVEGSAGGELADVEIATESARGTGAELAVFGGGDAHDAAEGAEGNDGGGEGFGCGGVEVPVEEEGICEALFEEAEAGDDVGPAPTNVADGEDVDLEDVAGLGIVDGDGAGEGVDKAAIDVGEGFECGGGGDLGAAGVDALEVDGVSGGDGEARRDGSVPTGVGGGGGEVMGGHG